MYCMIPVRVTRVEIRCCWRLRDYHGIRIQVGPAVAVVVHLRPDYRHSNDNTAIHNKEATTLPHPPSLQISPLL
jgi:hypothetical protein